MYCFVVFFLPQNTSIHTYILVLILLLLLLFPLPFQLLPLIGRCCVAKRYLWGWGFSHSPSALVNSLFGQVQPVKKLQIRFSPIINKQESHIDNNNNNRYLLRAVSFFSSFHWYSYTYNMGRVPIISGHCPQYSKACIRAEWEYLLDPNPTISPLKVRDRSNLLYTLSLSLQVLFLPRREMHLLSKYLL
ncbi:hypothetical protein GGS20DRAFT_556245 [Poronia punctata]|nr:hypothetical protein GGS20DRAFT_556245 [Poronia punctata]